MRCNSASPSDLGGLDETKGGNAPPLVSFPSLLASLVHKKPGLPLSDSGKGCCPVWWNMVNPPGK